MQQQKCVRSFSRGVFSVSMGFLALALAVVLSAGVASDQASLTQAQGQTLIDAVNAIKTDLGC